MTLKIRKLLPIEEDHNPSVLSLSHYSPTHSPSKNYQREDNPTTSNYYNNLKLNPPFDSAMALTVLVLLTALFFMGFFSIYIRRFSDEPSVDPTRRRRSSSSSQRDGSLPLTTSYSSRTRDSARGVDAKVVKALPVHAYFPGEGKQGMMIDEVECAICLSEFEEKELIKEIPYCGHVFHVECIDTWLESHVTCPLCRTAKLLVEEEEEKIKIEVVAAVAVEVVEGGGSGGESSGSSGGSEVRLVVEGGDTWNEERREVGSTTGDERRSTSCVWFGERVRLHRSLSF